MINDMQKKTPEIHPTTTDTLPFSTSRLQLFARRLLDLNARMNEIFTHLGDSLPGIHSELHRACSKASQTHEIIALDVESTNQPDAIQNLIQTLETLSIALTNLPGATNDALVAGEEINTIAARTQCCRDLADQVTSMTSTPRMILSEINRTLEQLVIRINATQSPTQSLMSRLQIHDIISQDLGTIEKGLEECIAASGSNSFTSGPPPIIEYFFQTSSSLMSDITSLILRFRKDLQGDIQDIKSTLLRTRHNLDHLTSLIGKPDCDAYSFHACIHNHCLAREELTAELNRLHLHLEHLPAETGGQQSHRTSSDVTVSGFADLHEAYNQREEDLSAYAAQTVTLVEDTAAMLTDSITSCLRAVDEFNDGLQEISRLFTEEPDLVHELKALAVSVSRATEQDSRPDTDMPQLTATLERINNPHIRSLLEKEENDTSLCIF